jgi:NAD(P)-dependent dehydrogenase (short-subunit alcohol dehydrogenase family)
MKQKKVLITGAASGIGRAAASRFAREGFDVFAVDINADALQDLISELHDGDHLIHAGSFAEAESVNEMENKLASSWRHLDVLVNCAGIFEKTDPLRMDLESLKKTFDIMVNGCVLMSQLAVRLMHDGGRIIHISSIHGTRAEASASAYSMAKAAINQFCRSLAVEVAQRNILVNAIAPGFVDTPMSIVDGQNELHSEWFRKHYIEGHHLPIKRPAAPSEIAGVAFFLAGSDASYITGQVITVDGGLTITF